MVNLYKLNGVCRLLKNFYGGYINVFSWGDANDRVATDLENLGNLEKSGNLKETSESQGICDRVLKVWGKSGNVVV